MWQKIKPKMRLIVIIAIAAVCLITSGIITLVSYTGWRSYFDGMMNIKAELEEQKRLEEEMKKLRFGGINIRLADGVNYFDNGKAHPVKSDFVVEGNYSIGGRQYSEEIRATDYTLEVPSDFVANGGVVKVSYVYTEEEGKDENDEPIIKETEYTAELELMLEAVKLAKIEVAENPYIVYYKAGETFKTDGMKITAINNDGSIDRNVGEADLKTDGSPLAAGTKKAAFWCDKDGEKIYGEVMIEVVEASVYDNGELVEMQVVGDLRLGEGESVSDLSMRVMGRYASGNLIELDESDYAITGGDSNTESVVFGGKYTFKVEYASNPDLFTYARVRVTRRSEAEKATLRGEGAVLDNCVGSLAPGSAIEFSVHADGATYADVYVAVSNGRLVFNGMTYLSEESSLFDVMNVRVNSKLSPIDKSALPAGGPYATLDEAYSDYTEIYLGKHWLEKGDNKIVLEFRDSKLGIKDYDGKAPIGRVDFIEVMSFDDSRIIDSIGEYVDACIETNVMQNYTTEQIADWTDFGCGAGWVYSSCTDNTYIYMYGRLSNSGSVRIVKYDPRSNAVVGWSKSFALSSEENAVLYYNGGYVYTTDAAGNFMRVSAADLDTQDTAQVEATDAVPLETGKVNGIYYNPVKRLYAVLFDARVQIYNHVGDEVGVVDIPQTVSATHINGSTVNVKVARITGNGRFIYVMYKANSVMAPVVRIYSFDGDFIGQVQFPNTREIMNVSSTFVNANAQSIVDMNGDVYFTLLEWNPNLGSVYKVNFNYEFIGVAHKDLGSYYEICTDKGVQMKYGVEVISGTTLQAMEKYPKGACTDGKYVYIEASNPCGEYGDGRVLVHKADMATGELLGVTSVAYYRTEAEQFANAGYLYYEDGKIYMACTDGKIRYVFAAEIDASGSAQWHEAELSFDIGTVVRSFTYNPALHEYAVVGKDGKLRIIDASTFEIKKEVALPGNKTGLYGDVNYIYSLYEGGAGNVAVSVYDWEGGFVGNVAMNGVISATSSNNAHSMFVHNDDIYILFCAWNNSDGWREGGILVKITLDYSVLNA